MQELINKYEILPNSSHDIFNCQVLIRKARIIYLDYINLEKIFNKTKSLISGNPTRYLSDSIEIINKFLTGKSLEELNKKLQLINDNTNNK